MYKEENIVLLAQTIISFSLKESLKKRTIIIVIIISNIKPDNLNRKTYLVYMNQK